MAVETLPIAERINAEALDLLMTARQCAVRRQFGDAPPESDSGDLSVTTSQYRVTSRLAWVVAWVAYRRAVAAGEMSEAEVAEALDGFADPAGPIWVRDEEANTLPDWLRHLAVRSHALCERVARLRTRAAEGAADGGDGELVLLQ